MAPRLVQSAKSLFQKQGRVKPKTGSIIWFIEQEFGVETLVHVNIKPDTLEYRIAIWLPNRQGVVFTISDLEYERSFTEGYFPTKEDMALLKLLANVDPQDAPYTRRQSKRFNKALSKIPRR